MHFSRSRSTHRRRLISGLVVALTAASTSHAQSDIDRPLPNVLLVVDSSGSMEFRAQDNELPVCHPAQPTLTNQTEPLDRSGRDHDGHDQQLYVAFR